MKLQQLRYAVETHRRNLNVSEAAEALFTSQPGVSKQIRLLEEELGVQIFIRSGKRMVAVTPAGRAVLEIAEQILQNVQKIKAVGSEFANQDSGSLNIATTPTIARYVLPNVLRQFMQRHPSVKLNLRQAHTEQLNEMVLHGEVDFALGNQSGGNANEVRRLLGKPWACALVLPPDNPLAQQNHIAWEHIISQPILTYDDALLPQSALHKALNKAGQNDAHIAFASNDHETLFDYIRLGLGVGIVDKIACQHLHDLAVRDISHLFEPMHLQILLRQNNLLRTLAYDFIELLQPEWQRSAIQNLLYAPAVQDFSI
ncbi:LysR substrate-binding domain-containing protein [Alysiella filiformis]|uniref:LysR family transcriptional regulator, cys regulon transcriptional activator n=1 Tax=Alysiella filiformis DSM 16848 TaxID=1120981 RepID=A0A286EDG3_9NEIS|nr:LysR substrate-binding domain-containing protein [Alysiella filiformis]QMT31209.1 LysR family transcriptional regulator [Alysiella filiformis]UBQ55793.1 LysR family transcriptional regulator [Alysiella filiformis DSM 16848]SOD68945.1 LysR family transcriptional regulator, cys regulon transcriptional activator [Alysiella filiformis DSM 16848]